MVCEKKEIKNNIAKQMREETIKNALVQWRGEIRIHFVHGKNEFFYVKKIKKSYTHFYVHMGYPQFKTATTKKFLSQ